MCGDTTVVFETVEQLGLENEVYKGWLLTWGKDTPVVGLIPRVYPCHVETMDGALAGLIREWYAVKFN